MPGQFVHMVVAEVVRKAHHAAERASELGVRWIQYPAVHHCPGKKKKEEATCRDPAAQSLKDTQRARPPRRGHGAGEKEGG